MLYILVLYLYILVLYFIILINLSNTTKSGSHEPFHQWCVKQQTQVSYVITDNS